MREQLCWRFHSSWFRAEQSVFIQNQTHDSVVGLLISPPTPLTNTQQQNHSYWLSSHPNQLITMQRSRWNCSIEVILDIRLIISRLYTQLKLAYVKYWPVFCLVYCNVWPCLRAFTLISQVQKHRCSFFLFVLTSSSHHTFI